MKIPLIYKTYLIVKINTPPPTYPFNGLAVYILLYSCIVLNYNHDNF